MALLYSWNTVASTENDADSPVTAVWAEKFRQNDYHLRQSLYGNGAGGFHTAVDGHKHTGTDSELVDLTGQIAQADLKTSSGEVSVVGGAGVGTDRTLPGGEYGFYPQLKTTGSEGRWGDAVAAAGTTSTSYVTVIRLANSAGGTTSAKQRYVTASGEIHWTFLLRDKATKEIISAYTAPDHPCFGNGGDPEKIQHPFLNFDADLYEVIVIQAASEIREGEEVARYPEWL